MISSVNIAVVGAGNLGFRHVEAIVKDYKGGCTLYVVDPNESSLEKTSQTFSDLALKNKIQLKTIAHVSSLPDVIDLVVVSTNASVRLSIIRSLLSGGRMVRRWLLEKVVFNDIREFEEASSLFEEQGDVAVWVNHPRRLYPFYQSLKTLFTEDSLVSMRVRGGNWGLGCNSLHFLDLFEYLTDETITSVDSSGVDRNMLLSKREGYIELTGVIRANSKTRKEIILESVNSDKPIKIEIETSQKVYTIYEGMGLLTTWEVADKTFIERKVDIVKRQSELTGLLAIDLISETTCSLPTYEESTCLHKHLINSLLGNEYYDESGVIVNYEFGIPIT